MLKIGSVMFFKIFRQLSDFSAETWMQLVIEIILRIAFDWGADIMISWELIVGFFNFFIQVIFFPEGDALISSVKHFVGCSNLDYSWKIIGFDMVKINAIIIMDIATQDINFMIMRVATLIKGLFFLQGWMSSKQSFRTFFCKMKFLDVRLQSARDLKIVPLNVILQAYEGKGASEKCTKNHKAAKQVGEWGTAPTRLNGDFWRWIFHIIFQCFRSLI